MSEPSDTDWRYGVYLFPLPPLLSLVAAGGMWGFIALTSSGSFSDADALAGIGAFLLTVAGSWLAILFALVVAVAAFMDARALAERGSWSPNRYAVGALGIVHLAATQLLPLSLLSTPLLAAYVYRRRQRVP
ncbi:hypothetical protein [Halolamina sp. C58]|uniref:hypothetical protein n=1 Tax=Halolamina sp. C58 TaxID=3421640 RepID=UPI003EBACD85